MICICFNYLFVLTFSFQLLNCVELDPGDRANFMEFVQKNLHLHEFRTGKKLSTNAAAAWIRRQMADYLRSRTPFRVNMLLGGMNADGETTSLYYMDYLASANQVNYGAQGYCGYMAPAVLDKYWKPDMSLEEGMEVMNKVIEQLKMRLVFKQDKFVIKVLTKDGIKVSYHETKK
jgi:20S proteasome subunit beta 4